MLKSLFILEIQARAPHFQHFLPVSSQTLLWSIVLMAMLYFRVNNTFSSLPIVALTYTDSYYSIFATAFLLDQVNIALAIFSKGVSLLWAYSLSGPSVHRGV